MPEEARERDAIKEDEEFNCDRHALSSRTESLGTRTTRGALGGLSNERQPARTGGVAADGVLYMFVAGCHEPGPAQV